GLDPQARRNLWDLIRGLKDGGATVIITTHYMDEAEILCNRVAIMDSGRIISLASPDKLIDDLVAIRHEGSSFSFDASLADWIRISNDSS
ncbi:MAG TPA: hypothetical protein PLJ27_13770, partial [Polyangiaceae bacterium]|nr:hypothetical protein [Polyangiaceae bacterium]